MCAVACVKKYRRRHLDRAATGSRTANIGRGRGVYRGRGRTYCISSVRCPLLLAFRNVSRREGERERRPRRDPPSLQRPIRIRVARHKFFLITSEKPGEPAPSSSRIANGIISAGTKNFQNLYLLGYCFLSMQNLDYTFENRNLRKE